jgi:hypothetical protein
MAFAVFEVNIKFVLKYRQRSDTPRELLRINI